MNVDTFESARRILCGVAFSLAVLCCPIASIASIHDLYVRELGNRYSAAFARWIPTYIQHFAVSSAGRAKRSTHTEDRLMLSPDPLKILNDHDGIQGGTIYYGADPPQRIHIVYDRKHHITVYRRGCCTWEEIVAVAGMKPPPTVVPYANLSHLQTVRGIFLGDTARRVRALYGAAPVKIVSRSPHIERLSYLAPSIMEQNNCTRSEHFLLRDDRVIAILFDSGC